MGLVAKPADSALARVFRPALTNYRGLTVGSLQPLFELRRA
jgi:hypothetical protein